MPNTCSAPGCRSNYSGEPYTPVFRLPSNSELREKWLRALHKDDIEDLKNVFVCSKHFRTEDVITEMDMPQPMAHYKKFLGDKFYMRTLYLVFFPVVPSISAHIPEA